MSINRPPPAQITQPHELRRAHAAAKHLEECLEVAGLPRVAASVRELRQRLWSELMKAERALGPSTPDEP